MNRTNRILAALLILNVIIGVSHATLTPLWQYHEPDYYTVIRFLISEHRFPEDADYADHNAAAHQATHPPLYFLITAPIVALFDDAQPVPMATSRSAMPGWRRASEPVVTSYMPTRHTIRRFEAVGCICRDPNVLFGPQQSFRVQSGQTLFRDPYRADRRGDPRAPTGDLSIHLDDQ
ncbi:MAG: hypothetical protein LC121_06880 [Anaerolineae bacterium]|nr:hypothetical protein [Anaerolineae bacterium]